ncbi:hypothetical protein FRX31_009725 [Thalictrum thalictroides]|uniref:Uncharacterized protein n=1 Tax=Thalictrum thalictroides TaxID=46969 RepID=A0A7J6WTJ3_THATH|nr:hypothetical protein FRX31_009725 [Thalictrum thalictroides]
MCNDGASGLGRAASRKIKQNKIPQRGLGVEKLERIRLEEQRKNSVIGQRPVIPVPLSRPMPRPGPAVGVPLRPPPQYQSSSSIPYPSASRANLSTLGSSAPLVTIPSSTSPLSAAHPPNVASNVPIRPYARNMNHIGSSSNAGRPPAFRWPLEALNSENTKFDTEYANGSSSDLDDRSEKRWPPLIRTQWRQPDNDPSSALPPSGLNQPEPPSNQNAYRNYLQYHQDKMVGIKRSLPFGLDNPPNPPNRWYPSHPTNVPSIPHPYRRLERNGNQLVREGSTVTGYPIRRFNFMGNSLQQVPNKRLKEKAALDGDSLSLAPPATNTIASSSTIPNLNQPIAFPPSDYHELSKIDMPLFRDKFEEEMQQHHNHFTSKEQHNDKAKSSPNKESPDDDLDLELKL